MEPYEVLGWLTDHGGFIESSHVHSTYEGRRQKPNGSAIDVKLIIYQTRLNGSPGPRYYARAMSSDGKLAVSNRERSIRGAVAGVQWGNLDK